MGLRKAEQKYLLGTEMKFFFSLSLSRSLSLPLPSPLSLLSLALSLQEPRRNNLMHRIVIMHGNREVSNTVKDAYVIAVSTLG